MTKPLVYIAGPYTSPDPVRNTHRAVREGLRIRETHDVAVLIPHVTMLADLIEPRHVDYWYQFDLDQLDHCDVLWRIPGPSVGADREVLHARQGGIAIVHNDDELATWLDHVWLRTA